VSYTREQMAEGLEEFEEVETEERVIGGQQAHKATFEHTHNGRRLRAFAYTVLIGPRVYVITGTALAERFGEHEEELARVAESFVAE